MEKKVRKRETESKFKRKREGDLRFSQFLTVILLVNRTFMNILFAWLY